MSKYDYRCAICLATREVEHGMSESPLVECCGKPMKKIISRCNVIIRNSFALRSFQDSTNREKDMRAELKENYGVHNFTPLGGVKTEEVLRDARGSGTYIKDQMALERQKNEERRRAKLKEWTPKAQKRANKRREEMRERKAAEAAEKRKITITA
jgi:predicted nucleic acid-binding Zn ribbon protein